jgi:uncharacterized membrane protein
LFYAIIEKVIKLKLIQLIFTFVLGFLLLYYLWPLFLVFLVILGFIFFRGLARLRSAIQPQDPLEQPRDLSQDDDIEKPVRSDVIDADFKERE